ncbi:right-handed parallel beta-helix repeat-containing protein [Bradyrhizobium sediminis]|uniref:right-handed parallel beta-helix repeat-containing protein n=1 Tax=Bradyrhizobium sediminis TaxID=2840469 RepID=UPI00201BA5FA|nr:right-handed parallel beta-helix repeat-containing protein [Bradyrhizobium sediminis]
MVLAIMVSTPSRADVRANWDYLVGAFFSPVSPELARDLGIPEKASLVLGVGKGGPLDRAGIERGDVIVAIDNRLTEAGKSGNVTILRQGNRVTKTITTEQYDLDRAELVSPQTAAAPRTITVGPSGGGNYRTITAAIVKSSSGDTIIVQSGIYREELVAVSGIRIQTKDSGIVAVEAANPLRLVGVNNVSVDGVTPAIQSGPSPSGTGMVVQNASGITLKNFSVEVSGTQAGIAVSKSRDVLIRNVAISGGADTFGIRLSGSQAAIADSVLHGHKIGVGIGSGNRGVILQNLFAENQYAVVSKDSELTIRGNSIGGAGNFALALVGSRALIEANTIRDYQVGVDLTGVEATLTGNTASQNQNVVQIHGGNVRVTANTMYFNQGNGVTVETGKRDARLATARVDVGGNKISMHNGIAILAGSGTEAVISGNIVEANQHGILVLDGRAVISGNTVVYQKNKGLEIVGGQADVSLDHNLVAYNLIGVAVDVDAKARLNYNNVYGNLARREYPLLDGNYLRTDQLPTGSGDKFYISVMPADDLKGATDTAFDPGFGDTPGNYQPGANSELARLASEGHTIGAIAPGASKN